MKIRQYNIIFSVFVLLLLAHLLFKPLRLFESRDLEGWYTKPEVPVLCLDSILSGQAQRQTEAQASFHNGLRPLMVRIHNEWEYDVYNEVWLTNSHFGRNGYICEYASYFYDYQVGDTARVNRYINQYLHLTEVLEKQGVKILWAIAPEKCYIYPENLPKAEKFNLNTEIASYLTFREQMIKRKVPFIDFNYLGFKEKKKYDFPVMHKRGKHWTRAYAARCLDSLIRYMNVKHACGPTVTPEYFKTDNPYGGDFDQENAMNLLFTDDGKSWTDARLKVNGDTSLKLLLIGDSFNHVVCWSGFFRQCFSGSSEFWYYNRQRSTNYAADMPITPDNYKSAKDFDFVVIQFSAMNISSLDWGTVDSLSHYFP